MPPWVVKVGERLAVVDDRVQGELQAYYNPIPWLFPPCDASDDENDDTIPPPALEGADVLLRAMGQTLEVPGFAPSRTVRPRLAENGSASEEGPADFIKRWPPGFLAGNQERRQKHLHLIRMAIAEEEGDVVNRIVQILRDTPCIEGVPDERLKDDIHTVTGPNLDPSIFHNMQPDEALQKLRSPPPVHGFEKQVHLSASIVANLRQHDGAWGKIQNLRECIRHLNTQGTLPSLHHARRNVISACAGKWDALPPGSSPDKALLDQTCKLCRTHACEILKEIKLEVLIETAAEIPLIDDNELRRLNSAKDIYDFLSLDPAAEKGDAQFLLVVLDGDYGDEVDEDTGRKVVTTKSSVGKRLDIMAGTPYASDAVKEANSRATAVRRLLEADPLPFLMYRAIHEFALSKGKHFDFAFNQNVSGKTILWAAAKFMIGHLQVFRTRQGAVFKRQPPAYTYVCPAATFLTMHAFQEKTLEPFRTYLHSVRGSSQDCGNFDSDGLAMVSDDIFWPATELDKRWYACKNGLYDAHERRFFKVGTDEYQEWSAKVTPYVFFAKSEWKDQVDGGPSVTPNFDKIFDAQGVTGGKRTLVEGLMGRSAHRIALFDPWHGTLFILGRAGTGKSTLLEKVAAKWHPDGLVGTLSNLSGGGVGQYTHLIDKELIIVTEVGDTFGGNGFAKTWLQMIEGAKVNIPIPREKNWEGQWTAPLLHGGNSYLPWPDPQGANARRVLLVEFKNEVADGSSRLAEYLEEEMMMIFHKCQNSYHKLRKDHGEKTFDAMIRAVCPEAADLVREASLNKDCLSEFFEQCVSPADAPEAAKSYEDFAKAVAEQRLVRSTPSALYEPNVGGIRLPAPAAGGKGTAKVVKEYSAFSLNALNKTFEEWRRMNRPGAKSRNISYPDACTALEQWKKGKDVRAVVFVYKNKNIVPIVTERFSAGAPNVWVVNAELEQIRAFSSPYACASIGEN